MAALGLTLRARVLGDITHGPDAAAYRYQARILATGRWTAPATDFETIEVLPDDYYLPWSKGLFVDLCDVGSFFHYEHKPAYEFSRLGTTVIRTIQRAGLWHSCEGIFYVTRARK